MNALFWTKCLLRQRPDVHILHAELSKHIMYFNCIGLKTGKVNLILLIFFEEFIYSNSFVYRYFFNVFRILIKKFLRQQMLLRSMERFFHD